MIELGVSIEDLDALETAVLFAAGANDHDFQLLYEDGLLGEGLREADLGDLRR